MINLGPILTGALALYALAATVFIVLETYPIPARGEERPWTPFYFLSLDGGGRGGVTSLSVRRA